MKATSSPYSVRMTGKPATAMSGSADGAARSDTQYSRIGIGINSGRMRAKSQWIEVGVIELAFTENAALLLCLCEWQLSPQMFSAYRTSA